MVISDQAKLFLFTTLQNPTDIYKKSYSYLLINSVLPIFKG